MTIMFLLSMGVKLCRLEINDGGKECISEVVLALQGTAKESWAMQS